MRPRILIVAPNLLYGEPNPRSIRARRLAAGLAGRGLEIEVLTWWSGQEQQPERPDWLGGGRLHAVTAASPFESWVEGAAQPPTEGAALDAWTEAAIADIAPRSAHHRPGLVWAIGVPVAALVAGARLAEALGVDLVADLGDPWQAPGEAAAAERERTLAAAAALVTTTEALAERLQPLLHPGTPIRLIPNGGEIRRRPSGPRPEPPLFVHLGAINAGRVDPRPAFAALAELHDEGKIEFRSHSTGFHPAIDELAHPQLPLLPHEQALELGAGAAAALVLGNDDPAQLPSKAFEIACTETWALCVREHAEDPAAALLERSGHAVIATANEPKAIRAAAEEIIGRERSGLCPAPDPAQSWDGRVAAVADLIGELAEPRHPS